MAISALASRQHGVVASGQLRDLGLTRQGIRRRVETGALHPLHRGVYAVGHASVTYRGRAMAAVLASGPEALLSHRSAGAAWDLVRPSTIEVTAARSRHGHAGFILHRSRRIESHDRAVVDGIPVTSVARTLVDLAEVLDDRRLSNAVHEAEIQKLFDLEGIQAALARVPGRTGRHRLYRVLEAYGGGPQTTRSEAERLFLGLCRRHGILVPQSAVSVAGYELDFLWPEHGLAVEVDGAATHHTIRAFYEDRRRDRALASHDIHVIRVTWLDLENEAALAQELSSTLAAKAG